MDSYRIDTGTRPEQTVVLYFDKKTAGSNDPDIFFSYSIPLDQTLLDRYGFIELGLDWFWYPVHTDMNEWKFLYDLNLQTDRPTLQVFSNGDVEATGRNTFTVRSKYPDFDINLFLLENAKVFSAAGNDVKIVGNANNMPLKDSIANTTADYLSYYRKIFGMTASSVTAVFRPIFNDPNAFGYSRKGYFVLPEGKNLASTTVYIAHELAHFWFIYGEPKENAWLTESFAEYSAMLAVRHFKGDSVFQEIIRDKHERLNRLIRDGRTIPAILRNGAKNKTVPSQVALYNKGPLILEKLRLLIGEEKLLDIMRAVSVQKIRTTEEFLTLLSELTSVKTAEFLRDELMQ
ncbi:MAG: hypothetical protein JWQ30_379 [Sediminibacterium sp.]|nr:hypothetical protein [Sediminibacterium sp.]